MIDITYESNKLSNFDYDEIIDDYVIVKINTPELLLENINIHEESKLFNPSYFIFIKNTQRTIEYIHLNEEKEIRYDFFDFLNKLNHTEIYKSDLRIISPPQNI